jgi:HK97 family phage major capsid protein
MSHSQGRTYARWVKALGVANGVATAAIAYAQARNWADVSQVVNSIKATIGVLGTDNMAPATPADFDFADLVRSVSVLGKLEGLRRVPSRVRQISATAGSAAYWAGERQPRRITRMTLAGETVEPLPVVAMLVSALELLQASDPKSDVILARDLAAAAAAAIDGAFLNFLDAGEARARPAGIGYGTTPLISTGSSLSQIDGDLDRMIQALSFAGSDLSAATWVLAPRTALYLSRLRGTGGSLAHPQMTVKGGTLLGLPAISSTAVPLEVGSPSNGVAIHLLDPSQILVVDEEAGRVEVSDQTSLQMVDQPGTGAQSMVSLFQTHSAAVKLTRFANWRRCRDGVAQVLTQVNY